MFSFIDEPLNADMVIVPTQVSHDHVAHHFFSQAPFCEFRRKTIPSFTSLADCVTNRQPTADYRSYPYCIERRL